MTLTNHAGHVQSPPTSKISVRSRSQQGVGADETMRKYLRWPSLFNGLQSKLDHHSSAAMQSQSQCAHREDLLLSIPYIILVPSRTLGHRSCSLPLTAVSRLYRSASSTLYRIFSLSLRKCKATQVSARFPLRLTAIRPQTQRVPGRHEPSRRGKGP